MFAEAELSEDGFLGGRLRIAQPIAGYRAATDPVILAAAVAAKPGETVLELGCGVGVASLCLGARVSGVVLSGLELQSAYSELARRNARTNGLDFEVIDGNLALLPPGLRDRSFDHVIANPPYFSAGDGTAAADRGRETAQREETPLALWVDVALRRLRPGGWLTMIQAVDRLPEMLAGLGSGAGSVTVLPIAARVGRDANRVILRARKGARGAFRLCAPFIVHEGLSHKADGDDYSPAARAILRECAALTL